MGLYFLHCDPASSACQSSLFVLTIDVEECHAISQNMKRGPEGPLSWFDVVPVFSVQLLDQLSLFQFTQRIKSHSGKAFFLEDGCTIKCISQQGAASAAAHSQFRDSFFAPEHHWCSSSRKGCTGTCSPPDMPLTNASASGSRTRPSSNI